MTRIQELALNSMPQWSRSRGQPWLQGGPQPRPQQQNNQWGPMGFSQWSGPTSKSTFNMPPQQNWGVSGQQFMFNIPPQNWGGGQWGIGPCGWNASGLQGTT